MLAVRDVQITVEVGAADVAPDASRPVQIPVVPDAPQAQGDREEVVKWRVQAVLLAARLGAVPPVLEIAQGLLLETVEDAGLHVPLTARLCALQLAVATVLDVMVVVGVDRDVPDAAGIVQVGVALIAAEDVAMPVKAVAVLAQAIAQPVVRISALEIAVAVVPIHALADAQIPVPDVVVHVLLVVRRVLDALVVAVLAPPVVRLVPERVPDHVLVAMIYVRHPVRHPVRDVMAVRLAETLAEVDAALRVRILAQNPVAMDAKTSVVDAALRALPHAARIAEILVRELVTVRHPHQFIKKEIKI